MDFLEKLEPYLVSDDLLVQDFVLHTLQDYPKVPSEWTFRLLQEAMENNEKETSILTTISKHSFNENSVKMLIKGLLKAEKTRKYLYLSLFDQVEPRVLIKHQHDLESYFSEEMWEFLHFLVSCTEDQLWGELGTVLATLEQGTNFNQQVFNKGKRIAYTLVQNDWISEDEIDFIFNESLNKRWFSYDGILAVYMIGLRQLEKHIPILASLLMRDEDILLEEVSDTLTAFQTDDVVNAVEPFLNRESSLIYSASILGNIKTPKAISTLRSSYSKLESAEDKEAIFEMLAHQLSLEGMPEIIDFMEHSIESFLVDREQVAYGYFTVIGEKHANLLDWKQMALKRELPFRNESKNGFANGPLMIQPAPIENTTKVGRNDPCPCGSGKKFKKCCLTI
ncbi:SEC-C metal-binding domain-containing protein [Rossellomorea sp. BNER]|uniref:SEC-C metal-binding domain-containing protein n=1 Tax=Rossellomorea sp. BNER TaxID=2962031 RepID=UPI003AF29E53